MLTGLLHQLGAIGVDDLDEMIECAELLGHGRLPGGRRFMAVTDSGGEAQLIGDHARALAFEVPAPSGAMKRRLQTRWPNFSFIGNPVDPWGVDPDFEVLYAEILDAMSDEDVDILAVGLDKVTTWMGANEVDLGAAAARSLIEAVKRSGKFGVFLTLHGMGPAHPSVRDQLREAGIPLLHGLRPAMVALRRAWYWNAYWRPRTPFGDGRPSLRRRSRSTNPARSSRNGPAAPCSAPTACRWCGRSSRRTPKRRAPPRRASASRS